MKKRIAGMLALLLCLVLACGSLAEVTTTKIYASQAFMNDLADSVAAKLEGDSVWTLLDSHGKALTTAPYRSMSNASGHSLFRVEGDAEDGLHDEGIIDAQGRELVPPVYADVTCVSEKWQIAVKCVAATEKDYDYQVYSFGSSGKAYVIIDAVDIYFDGTLAGTLAREDYSGRYAAYGDYLRLTDRQGNYVFYNSKLEKSPWTPQSGNEYVEVTVDGRGVVVHQGSGQIAFSAECQLTADEVENPYWYRRGAIVDLQGNEISNLNDAYERVDTFTKGYARTYAWKEDHSEYGVISVTGEEIIPCEYTYIDAGQLETMAEYGFAPVTITKDAEDYYGIINQHGILLIPCEYPSSEWNSRGTLIYKSDDDGKTTVMTPLAGELQEKYENVFSNNVGCNAFVVQKVDGTYAAMNVAGMELFASEDRVYINAQGTTGLARGDNGTWLIYDYSTEDAIAAE